MNLQRSELELVILLQICVENEWRQWCLWAAQFHRKFSQFVSDPVVLWVE